MVAVDTKGDYMRYWYTFDSILKRIVRVSADLSTAMRAFCYTFVLGLALRPAIPVQVGMFTLDQNLINAVSFPVLVFVLLDVAHPLLYLIGLHLVGACHWRQYKKYEGSDGQKYEEEKDRSELVIEPNLPQLFAINIFPTILLGSKVLVVGWLFWAFLSNLRLAT